MFALLNLLSGVRQWWYRSPSMRNRFAPCLILLAALAACGGSNGSGSSDGPESTGTLAYVVTQCRENDDGFFYG